TGVTIPTSTTSASFTMPDNDVACTVTNTYVKASPAGTTVLAFVFSDTITITGIRSGGTGAVVNFRVYGEADTTCQGTVLASALNKAIVNGVASSGDIVLTNGTLLGASGTFRVTAEYTGDAKNNAFTTACTAEKFQIVVRDAFGSPARDGFPGAP